MSWICPMCSTANDDSDETCMVCDAVRDMKFTVEATPEQHYKDGLAAREAGDESLAVQNFLAAAEKGYAPAENEYGSCLYSGKCVERDLSAAFGYFQRAAAAGTRRRSTTSRAATSTDTARRSTTSSR